MCVMSQERERVGKMRGKWECLAAEMSEERERERDISAEKKPREEREGWENIREKERENKREKYMDNVFVICIKCDI